MPEISREVKGGTMRLGARKTIVNSFESMSAKLYGLKDLSINERHRHRYEVNPDVVEELEAEGLRFIGRDETVRSSR